ncbi:MAG TPA: 5-deoxy-glucuronate isomerase [Methanocella sp.]|jgi:5-deoxy-D-glucuronate isomerase
MNIMSYKWNNCKMLDTLRVGGDNNLLTFETDNEKAEVYLNGNDIAKVVCTVKGSSTTITKAESHSIVVGEGNAQRDVYHFLKPKGPAPFLRLGITKHRGLGTWSSLPHPFELNPELGFEEVFFFMLEGGPQKAVNVGRGVWFDGSAANGVWAVGDHTWSTIPMGYHPVVGEPGVQVSYVWAYLAKKNHWEKI